MYSRIFCNIADILKIQEINRYKIPMTSASYLSGVFFSKSVMRKKWKLEKMELKGMSHNG